MSEYPLVQNQYFFTLILVTALSCPLPPPFFLHHLISLENSHTKVDPQTLISNTKLEATTVSLING